MSPGGDGGKLSWLRIIGSNHLSLAQTIRVAGEVFRGRDREKDCASKEKVLQQRKEQRWCAMNSRERLTQLWVPEVQIQAMKKH